jgi:hypothetical protein
VLLEKWEQHFAATRVCLPRQARQERLAFHMDNKVSGFAHLLARKLTPKICKPLKRTCQSDATLYLEGYRVFA